MLYLDINPSSVCIELQFEGVCQLNNFHLLIGPSFSVKLCLMGSRVIGPSGSHISQFTLSPKILELLLLLSGYINYLVNDDVDGDNDDDDDDDNGDVQAARESG